MNRFSKISFSTQSSWILCLALAGCGAKESDAPTEPGGAMSTGGQGGQTATETEPKQPVEQEENEPDELPTLEGTISVWSDTTEFHNRLDMFYGLRTEKLPSCSVNTYGECFVERCDVSFFGNQHLDAGALTLTGAAGQLSREFDDASGLYLRDYVDYSFEGPGSPSEPLSLKASGGADIEPFEVQVALPPPHVLQATSWVQGNRLLLFREGEAKIPFEALADDTEMMLRSYFVADGSDVYFQCTASSSDGLMTIPQEFLDEFEEETQLELTTVRRRKVTVGSYQAVILELGHVVNAEGARVEVSVQ